MSTLLAWFARMGEVPRYKAAYDALDELFKSGEDPWHFSTDNYETARFDKILEVVQRVPHASILDVGCAEGHLTRRLCGVADQVTAIDVSPTAVERARRAAPEAQVLQGRLEDMEFDRRFDLVVCSETVYYVSDVEAALRRLNSLGDFVLVTYTLYERSRLDPFFSRIPAIHNSPFNHLGFWESGRLVNWRGTQVVLWWTGAFEPWGASLR